MVASGRVHRWARSRTLRVLVLLALLDLLGPPILLPIIRNGASWVFGSGNQERRQSNSHYSGSFWGLWQSKPNARNFLDEHCTSLQHTYANLIDPMMALWNESGFSQDLLEHTSGDRVYISNGRLFLSENTSWGRTIPTLSDTFSTLQTWCSCQICCYRSIQQMNPWHSCNLGKLRDHCLPFARCSVIVMCFCPTQLKVTLLHLYFCTHAHQ